MKPEQKRSLYLPETARLPAVHTAERRAFTRPLAAEGKLPVFCRAKTEEKILAVTVDDCFQANNLEKMIGLARQYNARFTLFPIGKEAVKEKQKRILRSAWEAGFEIENHTYTHNGLYRCSDRELAEEISGAAHAISFILGGRYQCHFMRPKGGDASQDQRIHAYINQLGYYGVANWQLSSYADLKNEVKPGMILLFHTTDRDLAVMEEFLPYAAGQGYQLVTLNEMFGYPENEFTPCEIGEEMTSCPPLEKYEIIPEVLKKPAYSYSVYRMQQRLKELGYASADPGGVFGENTETAVKKYQESIGMDPTGIATIKMQKLLFSKDAQDPSPSRSAAGNAAAPRSTGSRAVPAVSGEWTHILLMGCDSQEAGKYDNSDCMIILSLDRRNNRVRLTSIMRDVWVLIPGFGEQKINAAVRYGGPELAMRTVSAYFDLPIEKYVMVNMKGMVHIIDLLGGVDIEITENERLPVGIWAMDVQRIIRSKVFIPLPEHAGLVHLCGAQAVGHARNRWTGDDFKRTERQRAILMAIAGQLRKKADAKTLLYLFCRGRKWVRTNLRAADLAQLVPLARQMDADAIRCLRIPAKHTFIATNGKISCLRIDFIENTRLLHEFLNEESNPDS